MSKAPHKVKVALIGTGRWGAILLNNIQAMPEFELVALRSKNQKYKNLNSERCTVYDNWQRAINDRNVEAVIIASPPDTHYEIVKYAVESRLPVFIEKPFVYSPTEAAFLYELARERNTPILVDHIHLFSDAFNLLKKELPRIGNLRSITARAGNWGPVRSDISALWDWAAHDIAMVLNILDGTPEKIQLVSRVKENVDGKMGENIRFLLEFHDTIGADINISNAMPVKTRYFKVAGDLGALIYDDIADNKLVHQSNTGHREAMGENFSMPLKNALQIFHSLCQGEKKFDWINNLKDAIDVIHILSEIDKC